MSEKPSPSPNQPVAPPTDFTVHLYHHFPKSMPVIEVQIGADVDLAVSDVVRLAVTEAIRVDLQDRIPTSLRLVPGPQTPIEGNANG